MKLWSLDEACLFDDLTELQKRLDRVPGLHPGAGQHGDQQQGHHVQQESSDIQLLSGLSSEGLSAGVDAEQEGGSLHQGAVGGVAQGHHCYSASSALSAGGTEGILPPLTAVTGYYVEGPTYAIIPLSAGIPVKSHSQFIPNSTGQQCNLEEAVRFEPNPPRAV